MESTIEKTLCHIQLLSRHLEPYNFRAGTVVILMELGVPTRCAGFEFLKKAIELEYEDPTRALCKDMYLEIASCYQQCSGWAVERGIRQAIKRAWMNGSQQAWNWYFSYNGQAVANKPTNSEFISRIAYILKIWQECEITRGDYNERN